MKKILYKISRVLPDNIYLRLKYYQCLGEKLNLNNPKTFNEKIQWLKLNNRDDLYTKMVDKYEVREYIKERIGEEYLIPLIDVYENIEDIKWDKLPDKFVLKWTHDSGSIVICKDKNNFDINKAIEKLNSKLENNTYWYGREWPYKNVKPRIICEQYLETSDGNLPVDYKFYCFNGNADSVLVCPSRSQENPEFYFFDREWNLLKYNTWGINAHKDFTLPKPNKIKEMFDLADFLSKSFPFLRVDLYCENDKIYFGELTFFPKSGFNKELLKNTNYLFGDKIDLNLIQHK